MTTAHGETQPLDVTRGEWRRVAAWSALVMAATCLPYAIAWFFCPSDGVFPGVLYNADDHGVYLAWMRQAADGHFLFRNLFTTDPQRGIYFHLWFLVLGWLGKLLGNLPLAYHVGRVLAGFGVLLLTYRLAAFFTRDLLARAAVFWVTATGAGLGWLTWTERPLPAQAPTDQWQPEAVTFHSLYTNGLFAVSLALMLGVLVCLLQAERRGMRWAVGAGCCGLLLGNIHSYDVIHLTAVWGLYLLLRAVCERRWPGTSLVQALVAAAIAAPSVAHMYWFYRTEPVFQMRADTATWSFPIHWYLLGAGLLLPLAVVGIVALHRTSSESDAPKAWFPAAWCVAGLLVAYAPFAFQRKLVMGWHNALALAAGIGVAFLARRLATDRSPRLATATVIVLLLLLVPSTILFASRDVRMAVVDQSTSTSVHPAYWPSEEFAAFEWLRANSPAEAVALRFPPYAVFIPMTSGRAVYAGHWGETTRFSDKLQQVLRFFRGADGSDGRRRFLEESGVSYVVVGTMEDQLLQDGAARYGAPPLEREPFLETVWSAERVRILRVRGATP